MKKNRLLNLLTVLAIVVIAVSTAMVVRHVRDNAQEKVNESIHQPASSDEKATIDDSENDDSVKPAKDDSDKTGSGSTAADAQSDGDAGSSKKGEESELPFGNSVEQAESGGAGNSGGSAASQKGDSTAGSNGSTDWTCTIQITCASILDHMDDLKKEKRAFVPSDGVIIPTKIVTFKSGESVYDITRRVCSEENIQIEASYTPLYESYYVEGINQIYEFDCGKQSGWMFTVNGKSPDYGCSQITVQQGDRIIWEYTCTGK